MTLTLRQRLKKVQPLSYKAVQHPLLPAEARALIAETVLLQAELVETVERLEKWASRRDQVCNYEDGKS